MFHMFGYSHIVMVIEIMVLDIYDIGLIYIRYLAPFVLGIVKVPHWIEKTKLNTI